LYDYNHKIIPVATVLLVSTLLLASTGLAQPSQAQDEVSQEVKIKYSLFYEYFKNEDYESASPHLSWLLENVPTYRGQRNWRRGITMYEGLAEAAEDPEMKKAYLDSALALHDRIIPTFEEAGKGDVIDEVRWTINRGRFLQSHSDVYNDRQDEVFEAYMKAYEMAPGEVDPYYIRYIVDTYVQREEKQKAVDFMEKAEPQYSDSPELLEYFNETRDNLFTNPKERVAFLEDQLESAPEDIDILNELFELYQDLDRPAKVEEIGDRLLELEPNAETYKLLGEMNFEQSEYGQAMTHFENGLDIAENPTTRRDIYQSMAEVQEEQGNLQNARQYARQALEIDDDFGPAYMLIASVYATAVQQSDSMDREDRAVYWLVIDYYERAARADPSVRNRARRAIKTYRKYIPSREDMFFKGWEEGDSYTVDYGPYSWINETTTVRSP
jgi:tetratricopeptide (TPR) repeat protein